MLRVLRDGIVLIDKKILMMNEHKEAARLQYSRLSLGMLQSPDGMMDNVAGLGLT